MIYPQAPPNTAKQHQALWLCSPGGMRGLADRDRRWLQGFIGKVTGASQVVMTLSSALFFAPPLFLLVLVAARRPALPLLCLVALLAIAAAALGLADLPKAQAVAEACFVFALESSSLYIIYTLSSYRVYVTTLFILLSCATLFSILSAFLPVPSVISPVLLILFSLLSFPILSYLIFPSARGSRTQSRLTASPSLIPFPSLAPPASSAASGAFSQAAAPEKSARYEIDLEGPSRPNHNNSSVAGALLLIAQFLFLISSIFNICSTSSALKTLQTAFFVVSSLFTTFAYSQYVQSFICTRDCVPEQVSVCNPTTRIYTNINSTNDATVPLSQHNLSPSASMSFPLRGRTNSGFTLASHHTGASQTLHVNGQAASKAVTASTIGPVPLWIRTDDATLNHRDGATVGANRPAANDINFIYMPTPVRVLPPSLLFPDDNPMGPATTADLRQNAPYPATSDVASDIAVATHWPDTSSKKAPMLVHKRSAWSMSSSSAVSVPIVSSPTPTPYSSSSSLTLSGIMKPRSQTLSTSSSSSSRQVPLLAKCVPLDVLSRKMEMAENLSAAVQPGVVSGGKDRRDRQQAWLRVDNGMIGSRSRSISAASSLTVYDGPEWVHGGKEKKKRGGFIFGRHGQGDEERQDNKIQDEPIQASRSPSFFNRQGIPSIRRVMRGRSLSISLLSNLIGRRKSTEQEHDEDANEQISPSSSISVSSTSLLSSLSMSLSRGPASPASPASPLSLRTPGTSEPGSPTDCRNDDGGSGKKNSLYYWKSRKVKKDVSNGAVSDLQQSVERDRERERDYERVGLMVGDQGPPDFMDLTDPFAPPDLGTRMSVATTADDMLLGEGSGVIKANMWGRLPPVVTEQKKAAEPEAHRAVLKPQVSAKKTNMGAVEAGRRAKGGGSVGRVKRTTSIGRSRSRSKSRPVFGSLKGVSSADAATITTTRTGAGSAKYVMRKGSVTRTRIKRSREEEHDRGGLDVEEALLAQKLLMKLDLAPGF